MSFQTWDTFTWEGEHHPFFSKAIRLSYNIVPTEAYFQSLQIDFEVGDDHFDDVHDFSRISIARMQIAHFQTSPGVLLDDWDERIGI
jgi:hypothetical protein